MSEYQVAMVPKLMLLSMDLLRPRLGLKALNFDNMQAELLTTGERSKAFGESLSRRITENQNSLFNSSAKIAGLAKQFDAVVKTVSIAEALTESRFALLNEMAQNSLSSSEKELISKAKGALKAGNAARLSSIADAINPIFDKLNERLRESHLRLKAAERDYIKEGAVKSLEALGYTTRIKERSGDMLVRGTKEGLSVAVQMTEGEVHIDMAGFEGGRCKVEMDRINQELSKHGIVFEIKKREHHGKKEGGVLAQAAEREFLPEFNPLNEQPANQKTKINQGRNLLKANHLKNKLWR